MSPDLHSQIESRETALKRHTAILKTATADMEKAKTEAIKSPIRNVVKRAEDRIAQLNAELSALRGTPEKEVAAPAAAATT